MLAPFFHAWERRLADVSKDRIVRPFDWGLDWLAANGHHQALPEERVAAWVMEVMQDTPAFFETPPTSDYTFTDASPELQKGGEAGTLRFPSALVTPHPENNTVVGRWFPAEGESPLGKRKGRGRAVVVMSLATGRASGSRIQDRQPSYTPGKKKSQKFDWLCPG